jgi:hypothetical protein
VNRLAQDLAIAHVVDQDEQQPRLEHLGLFVAQFALRADQFLVEAIGVVEVGREAKGEAFMKGSSRTS